MNEEATSSGSTSEAVSEGEQLGGGDSSVVEMTETAAQDRPFFTTSFSEYSVTEGLLLMLLVLAVVMICVKMIRGGFSWL